MTYLESVTEAYERGYKVGVAHGRAENIEAIEAQRQERERVVALMTFLRWWDEEPEDMTDERIVEMVKKWETDFVPSLAESHSGDCTNVPAPCVRCHTEALLATAHRIAKYLIHP